MVSSVYVHVCVHACAHWCMENELNEHENVCTCVHSISSLECVPYTVFIINILMFHHEWLYSDPLSL